MSKIAEFLEEATTEKVKKVLIRRKLSEKRTIT